MNIEDIKQFLKEYEGTDITIMEVCGSHTNAIAKNGIKGMLSDKIKLVSGPGCPVCVTPSAYIDKLIDLSKQNNTCVVTFGDMLRVPGSKMSLMQEKSNHANVKMVYSPFDTLKLAVKNPQMNYVFAAVGFETTTPAYALLLDEIVKNDIKNIKILTSLKTMPQAISWLCDNGVKVDAFLAPGHVCAITGSDIFAPLAKKYNKKMAVAGFEAHEILLAVYGIVNVLKSGEIYNYYPNVVTTTGNVIAMQKVNKYFEKYDATWRGMGVIPDSGMILKKEYRQYDAGSFDLIEDIKINKACCCDKVLMGKITPLECPLFGKICTPANPQGACMVSTEGSCASTFSVGSYNNTK